MYIQRQAETILREYIKTDKIVMMLGARQVGKTTLVQQLLKEMNGVLLNLDIEIDKNRLLSISHLSPDEVVRSLGNPSLFIIDEAQRVAEVGRIVKGWWDSHIPLKIVLLGSSSLNLLDQSAESLTGRNVKLYLSPLTFNEVLKHQTWYKTDTTKEQLKTIWHNQIQTLLLHQMVYGSYPETIVSADEEAYILNLVSDYLLKDVLQLGLVKSPEVIKKLLLLLAHQIGSEVSLSELASRLQIARQTVKKYIELLERTFVIFRLPAFSANQRKEITKSTKIFFWDTGVRNGLLKDFTLSEYRGDRGRLWENFIISEIAKQNLLAGQPNNLYFWRTRDGAEVDLIIKGTDRFSAYEIKWSMAKTVSVRSFTSKYSIEVQQIAQENAVDFLSGEKRIEK